VDFLQYNQNMLNDPDYSLSLPALKPPYTGGVVAIGNFDGVHRGHQALLAQARAIADQQNIPCIALTFSPHPRRFFQPHAPAFMLCAQAERDDLLRQAGADHVAILPFNTQLSQMSAEEFIQHILRDWLQARHIVVGQNFVFGRGRQGHVDTLMAHGFDVTGLAQVTDAHDTIYSSTAIRQAIMAHDFTQAESLLGRTWAITGNVIAGAQRGRTIGFPTANLLWPHDLLQPPFGVYAVTVQCADGTNHSAIANFGVRPTIHQDDTDAQPLLEVHLFDFSGDLYGQAIRITPHHFIRPEQSFPDLAALQAQITQDVQQAQLFHLQLAARPV
jgi:riboflavin kinase/FMN adenylyltransferase